MDENQNPEPTPVVEPTPAEPTPAPELEQSDPVPAGVDLTDYDEVDVAEALKRDTADGPGFKDEHELPAPDFDGFPADDVETEETP